MQNRGKPNPCNPNCSKDGFLPKSNPVASSGLTLGLWTIYHKPRLVRPLGRKKKDPHRQLWPSKQKWWSEPTSVIGWGVEQSICFMKSIEVGEQGGLCQEQISEKKIHFPRMTCVNHLKLNITELSSDPTVLISCHSPWYFLFAWTRSVLHFYMSRFYPKLEDWLILFFFCLQVFLDTLSYQGAQIAQRLHHSLYYV